MGTGLSGFAFKGKENTKLLLWHYSNILFSLGKRQKWEYFVSQVFMTKFLKNTLSNLSLKPTFLRWSIGTLFLWSLGILIIFLKSFWNSNDLRFYVLYVEARVKIASSFCHNIQGSFKPKLVIWLNFRSLPILGPNKSCQWIETVYLSSCLQESFLKIKSWWRKRGQTAEMRMEILVYPCWINSLEHWSK